MRILKSFLQTAFVVVVFSFFAFVFLDSIGPGNLIENAIALLKGLALWPLQVLVLGVFLGILWLIGFLVKTAVSELIRIIRRQSK